ncbi:MAG: ATP-binding cassette domain-containing protein [Rhodospirillaceae bacterium]|nr:ATP-binding cassette domain-containing protein [Rhodospirillaceae bacterium]
MGTEALADFAGSFGESRAAEGNQPFRLNEPDVVWYVEKGALDILVTEHIDGRMRSPFRHVMRREEGRLAFGVDESDQPVRFIGKGIPGTRLRSLRRKRLIDGPARREDSDAFASALVVEVDAWIEDLAAALTRDMEAHPAIACRVRPGETTGSGVVAAMSGVVWIISDTSNAIFVDLVSLSKDPVMAPLTPASWIRFNTPTPMICKRSGALDMRTLLTTGLSEFHRLVLSADVVSRQLLLVDDANLQRIQASRRQREKAGARRSLAALVDTDERTKHDETPLVRALRLIGRHEGIDIRMPTSADDSEPSLEAYCEASGIRRRRLRLTVEDKWWLGDSGTMLAFRRDDGQPVVLLPGRFGRYRMIDPGTGDSSPAGAQMADGLRDAWLLYPGLQDVGAVRIRDLLHVGAARAAMDVSRLVVAGLGAGLLALAPAVTVDMLITEVLPADDATSLIQLSAILVGLAFAAALSQVLRGTALMRLEARFTARIGAAIWNHLLRMHPGFFRRFNAGDLAARSMIFQDVRDHVSGVTADAVLSTLFALPALGLLFYYSTALGWGGLCLSLGAISVTATFCILHVKPQRRYLASVRQVTDDIHQFLNGIVKLRTTGSEDSAFALWARHYREQKEAEIGLAAFSEQLGAFSAAVPALATAILFAVVGSLGGGALTTAEFLAAHTAAMVFSLAFVMLGNSARAIAFVKPACEQVQPILTSPVDTSLRQELRQEIEGDVHLERISFAYPGASGPVLEDVSLHARRGEFVAIVGASGAGKSTIFRLALGLEEPSSGAVYYDNRDLAYLDLAAVRRQIGVVMQDGPLMDGTILDNIIGVTDDLTTNDAWRAARQAGIDEDIRAMPMNLHTVVDQNPAILSGGQSQRIRIAAALARNPRIIFLDEPTSWLDTRSQALTMKGIEESTGTRLVIAHRLSTIRMADRIYVLDGGRIVQTGSFDELVAEDGPFRDMASRQVI